MEPLLSPSSEPFTEGQNRLLGLKLLLVEDNEMNQIVARGMLEQAGATIEVMEDGRQAIEHLRTYPEIYDVVLMDIQMPVLDGFNASRIIREELKLTLPIIAMTAGVMESEKAQCFAAGMNNFIAKPINFDQMIGLIEASINTNQLVRESHDQQLVGMEINSIKEVILGPADSVDIFSPEKLVKFMEANLKGKSAIVNMVANLVSSQFKPIENIKGLIEQGKNEDAAHLLHTMRGSFGMFGTKRFNVVALELEHELKQKKLDRIPSLISLVEREFSLILDLAKPWLISHQ